ncbi:hypothetical protein HII28_19370 [Planctomonas sp. JC2975]|uniref:hypothetical protein n=1 Tax=Planctomonas sp. JC2975 TaxID=2729626 RepID=UPI0014742E10|nr:hypothetical protein [Planctomonas sp. JC2975]NNC14024.1 hypothetical protein [Planctomonas sp. JC2975]
MPRLVPYALADAERKAIAVWNAGGDDAPGEFSLRLDVSAEQTPVVHVRRDGSRTVGSWIGGVVRLSEPLRPWEFIVLGLDR